MVTNEQKMNRDFSGLSHFIGGIFQPLPLTLNSIWKVDLKMNGHSKQPVGIKYMTWDWAGWIKAAWVQLSTPWPLFQCNALKVKHFLTQSMLVFLSSFHNNIEISVKVT